MRERRGSNHLLFGEVYFSQDKESPMSIRFSIWLGKEIDSMLNVGDVREITFRGFFLSKVRVQ